MVATTPHDPHPRLQPAARLLHLAWLLVAVAVATAFYPPLAPLTLAAAALLAILALLDGGIVFLRRAPAVTRDMPHAFALGQWREIALHLENTARYPLTVEVFDLHPDSAESEQLPACCRLAPATATRVCCRLRFNQRGDFSLPGTQLRITGPLGLLHALHTVGAPFAVRVYPDFAAVARYALLATDNRLSQLGIRRRQRRGEGLEFQQLREYRPGDALRQIDWKATSRLRKLVSREYQEERDQQVMFLLDCGFRMRAQDDGIAHFDAALNAMLLLCYVVLRQGDAAGCMTFAGGDADSENDRHFAAAKGRDAMTRLMNGLFDLQPTGRTPDFRRLATDCAARLHKRSLLVLVTNVRDEDTEDLVAAAKLLGERHLVLVATLRERVLDDTVAQVPENAADAVRVAAARLYLGERERALARLVKEGLLVLDCTPEQLPVRLVNAYLDIKRSGRL